MSETQDPNAPHDSAQGVDRKEASGCPVSGVTAHGSESENPAIDSPTPKTTEKTGQTGAGAKANLKAAKTSRDGAKATAAAKGKTPATKSAEKAPAKPRAPRKPKAGGDA